MDVEVEVLPLQGPLCLAPPLAGWSSWTRTTRRTPPTSRRCTLCAACFFLRNRLCCPFCMVLLLFLSNSLNIQNGFASLDTVLKSFLKYLVYSLQAIYAWLPAGQNGAVVRAVSGRPPPYQAKQAEQEQLFVLTQVLLVSTALCTQAIMHDNL